MNVIVGLLGVLLGTLVTASAQLWVRSSERRERWLSELLVQCAEIYALEATFRGRANDAAYEGDRSRLEEWPRMPRRIAEAKISLLTTDEDLLKALDNLGTIGRRCYAAAIARNSDFEDLKKEHFDALQDFSDAARRALKKEKVI